MSFLKRLVDFLAPLGFLVAVGALAWTRYGKTLPGGLRPYLVAALAGLGNSVFHPADFTVLNRHVSQPRLGHAFSVHGLSGNLGWALAPVFLIGVAGAAHQPGGQAEGSGW